VSPPGEQKPYRNERANLTALISTDWKSIGKDYSWFCRDLLTGDIMKSLQDYPLQYFHGICAVVQVARLPILF